MIEIPEELMMELKKTYSDILVNKLLNSTDPNQMISAVGSLGVIDRIFKAAGQRTVIIISSEPTKMTDSNIIHQTTKVEKPKRSKKK